MPILNWLDRDKDVKVADSVPYKLLEQVDEFSYGDIASQNMLIQGDNLEALKALLPYYAGQVKCIYIDPPYNTGSAFEHYDDNLEHSTWLSMMYPRLELLRELLAEDGSIWINLDDNEAHYMKVICDEIFGRKNFVTNICWQKIHSIKNDARLLSVNHDLILVYSKNIESLSFNLLPRTETMNARFANPDNDPRGAWSSGDLVANEPRVNGNFIVRGPTGKEFNVPSTKHWVYSQENLEKMIAENRIWFGANGTAFPRKKRFLSEVQQGRKPDSWWLSSEVGHNQEAKREVRAFNQEEIFGTPKPERLMNRIILMSTNPNDLVLDSFLGSGTTAAVAHKMGRRYIGIEMGEHSKTHCYPRLKAVVEGEQGGISKAQNWQGGGGFKFYQLGEAIFDAEGNINKKIKFNHLAAHIWFSETLTSLQTKPKTPLLGVHNNIAYYLLYNGILGDKRPDGGNVLTSKLLKELPPYNGQKVIYGETSRLSHAKLKAENIIFKQTPYDIKAR
jgi:adenine-specific DNA-methyltransferase